MQPEAKPPQSGDQWKRCERHDEKPKRDESNARVGVPSKTQCVDIRMAQVADTG
jgi:hypothetical protein